VSQTGLSAQVDHYEGGVVKRQEPYRRWPVYLKSVGIWFLVTLGISAATVLGIFNGIYFVMDHFLKDDRFYQGFAVSVGISACGTVILFVMIFLLIRRIGRYPRRRFKGVRGI
jgi:ABC-type Fe3+ transport system permease subunit